MLVAERDALHASVNHERLSIKERELLNLTTYLNSIGTQAALIAGFIYGTVMTQLPNGVHPTLKYAVHVSSSISLGAMVYVICNSELTSIFGSTMALVGPPGAMSASLIGMKDERSSIAQAFSIGMGGFMATTIGGVWVFIDDVPLACTTSVTLVCFFAYTIRAAMRIHRRFPVEAGLSNKNLNPINASDYLSTRTDVAAPKSPNEGAAGGGAAGGGGPPRNL